MSSVAGGSGGGGAAPVYVDEVTMGGAESVTGAVAAWRC